MLFKCESWYSNGNSNTCGQHFSSNNENNYFQKDFLKYICGLEWKNATYFRKSLTNAYVHRNKPVALQSHFSTQFDIYSTFLVLDQTEKGIFRMVKSLVYLSIDKADIAEIRMIICPKHWLICFQNKQLLNRCSIKLFKKKNKAQSLKWARVNIPICHPNAIHKNTQRIYEYCHMVLPYNSILMPWKCYIDSDFLVGGQPIG